MKAAIVDFLVRVTLMLLVALAAFWAGDRHRNNAWLAQQAKVERDAHAKYAAEVKRGQEAADRHVLEQIEKEQRYAELEKKFSALRARVPLLVPPAAAPAPQAAGAGSEPRGDPPGAVVPGINVVIRPELSLGAVWLWNSALAGADVPAGACGADAVTGEACAATSGLTTADAWDNQAVNAKSCAEDRLRYQRLIDYLGGRVP